MDVQKFSDKLDLFSKAIFKELNEIKAKMLLSEVFFNEMRELKEKLITLEQKTEKLCDCGKSSDKENMQRQQPEKKTFVQNGSNTEDTSLVEKNTISEAANIRNEEPPTSKPVSESTIQKLYPEITQDQADIIARLIHDKFDSFAIKDLKNYHLKILAGIVMRTNSEFKVISVAMGTKCINRKHLSKEGKAINDMHAEIIARRCLIGFFYDQLELIAQNKETSSIFSLNQNGKGYRLKNGVEFHLYVNATPCGDATYFGKNRPVLRVIPDDRQGTCYLDVDIKQTVEGSEGEPLLTMSCSDKICKWNVVGVQGALLSHFLEPIYLKSVIIGTKTYKSELKRAIYARIEQKLKNLPTPYRHHRPSTFWTKSHVLYNNKAPSFSVLWSAETKPELIVAKTGRPPYMEESKFCKRSFATRFLGLKGRISSVTDIQERNFCSYAEIKKAAGAYEEAKNVLLAAFRVAELGQWTSKPEELDEFHLPREIRKY